MSPKCMHCCNCVNVYGTYDNEINLTGLQVINDLLPKLEPTGTTFANMD